MNEKNVPHCIFRHLNLNAHGCNIFFKVLSDGTCTSWGNADVSIFDPNPYKDGKYNILNPYHKKTVKIYIYFALHILFTL